MRTRTLSARPVPSIFGNGRWPTGILHLRGKVFTFLKLPLELDLMIYDGTLGPEQVMHNGELARTKLQIPLPGVCF